MSNFLGTAVYNKFKIFMRFSLYSDASSTHINKWNYIRHKLFRLRRVNNSLSITRDDIFNKWKENCVLKSNRELPILSYNEEDFDINDMRIYKRIYFIEPCFYCPNNGSREYSRGIEGEIRMEVIDGIDNTWSLEEIQDLLKAFEKTCNEYLHSGNACKAEIILTSRH